MGQLFYIVKERGQDLKFFHLADLHFGKSIYGRSLIDDQADWIIKFIELCKREDVDAVVVAGDVYDRAAPAADAVRLLDTFVTGLRELEIPVLMVAGNHDSGDRLAFAKELLKKEGLYIAGKVKKELDHISIKEKKGSGEVTFWMMPYIFPEEVKSVLLDEDIRNYDQACRALIGAQDIDPLKRNVLIAHQNVIANGTEPERGGSESMVGGVGEIDYSAFDSFDYVALGHIHSSYPVGREEVRYAGTPLCYHFEETRQKSKGALLVTIGEKGTDISVEHKMIVPLHKMEYLVSDYEDIIEELKRRSTKDNKGIYYGIVIKDRRINPEISQYLRGLIENMDSYLLDLSSDYHEYSTVKNSARMAEVKEKRLEELFADLITRRCNDIPPSDEEFELLKYVSEIMDNSDIKEEISESDIDKIISKAGKIGGEAV